MALGYFSKNFLAIVDKHAPFKKLRKPWFSPELSTRLKQETEYGLLLDAQGTHPIGLPLGN